MKPYEVIKSKEIYEGKIFKIVQDEISLPNGNTATRDVLIHKGACAILPIDQDGKLILVRQHRHPVNEFVLEMPAGKLDSIDEKPEECAIRELEEEIGYKSNNFSFMFKTFIAVGYSSEVIHVYLARDLVETKQNLDEDEFLEIERYTLEEALDMIYNGIIVDSKTIAAVLFYNNLKDR